MASISKTANVNLLSSQGENLSELQQQIREQAKLELFQTLDLDKRKFTDIDTTISDLKAAEKDNTKPIIANNIIKYTYAKLKETVPFKEIFEKYSTAKDEEKEKMYMEISERIILSNSGVISYKEGVTICGNKIDENFVKQEYETLNKVDAYKGNLDFFTVKDKDGKLYIIKRKAEELRKIKERENQLKDEKLDEILGSNKKKDQEIEELKKKLSDIQENRNKLNYNKRQIQLLEQRTVEMEIELNQMLSNKGGFVMAEGIQMKVTDDLIDRTRRQIELNKEKLKKLKGMDNEGQENQNDSNNTTETETSNEAEEQKERIKIINILSQILQSINSKNVGDINIKNEINNAVEQMKISLENGNTMSNQGNNVNIQNNIENIQILYNVLCSLLTIINNNYANISNVNMGMYPMFYPNMMSCVQMMAPYVYGSPYYMGYINGGNINGGNVNNVNVNSAINEQITQLMNQIQILISKMGNQGNGGITNNPTFTNNPTNNPEFTNNPTFNPVNNAANNPAFNPTFNPTFNPVNNIDNSNVNTQMMTLLQLMVNQLQQINNNGTPDTPTDGREVSTDGTEVSTDGTEVSTDGTEVSTDGTEVSTDGTEVSTDGPSIEQREWVATISNVRQINRAIAQREADEELRQRYENVGWNIFDRANLFLRRKFIKDRIVSEKMGGRRGFDWSEAGQSAADRHQIEQQNDFAERMSVVIQDIDTDNYPETRRRMDELLGRLTGRPDTVPPRQRAISDAQFQTEFQSILNMSGRVFDTARPSTATNPNWRPISEIIRTNRIDQLSTNILMQANKFREQQVLTWSIMDHIARDPRESDVNFDAWCRGVVKNYIDRYNDIPDFFNQMGVNLDDKNATTEIRRLQANDGALTMISAQSLRLRIQLLDDGGEAYNVRKKGGLLTRIGRFLDDPTGGENTRFGRWMNDHPGLKESFGWIWGATKLGVMVTPGFLLAPFGPLAVAGGVGGMSFLTTLFKKKAHYEKESRSYKRMQATNLADYRAKRTQLANEVAGMKRYQGRFWGEKARIREQYRDYVLTSHDQLSLSNDLLHRIEYRLQDQTPLTDAERTNFAADVADGLARLDYHRRTGENFLGSDDPNVAEREYRNLQNAVMGGLKRLGFVDANGDPDVNIFRTTNPFDTYYHNTLNLIENGTGDEYDTQGYLQARRKFRRRSNGKSRWGALKAGSISFALSYLASSLASRDQIQEVETLTNKSSGKYGGEYHPGDVEESLLIPGSSPTGSINPEMNSVITDSTAEITGGTLYSSVDAIPCSLAKGTAEYAAANTSLTSSLSIVSGNPDLVAAVNKYVTDATSSIMAIPGLDAGNQQLAIARAIEAIDEGILKPIIHTATTHPDGISHIADIAVNPTGFLRTNGGVQASGSGIVGQSFRNMGLLGLDYVEKGTEEVVKHITRAIPIPVGLNTFGSPKSDPHTNKGQRQGQRPTNNGQRQRANGQRP